MARVPVPGFRNVFTDIPDVVDTGEGSGFAALAEGLKTASGVIKPLALQDAAARGASSVGRDGNGNLQAGSLIPFTDIDAAFNEASRVTYMSELDGEFSSQLAKIAFARQDDPQGFAQDAGALRDRVVRGAPAAFRGDVSLAVGRKINSAHTRIVGSALKTVQQRASNSNQAMIERLMQRRGELSKEPTQLNLQEMAEIDRDLAEQFQIKENLPGSTWTSENSALAMDRANKAAATNREAYVKSEVSAAIDLYRQGYVPENIDAIREMTQGTEVGAELDAARRAYEFMPEFSRLSPRDMLAVLRDRSSGEVSQSDAEEIAELQKIADAAIERVTKDPIEYAANAGTMSLEALDFADPESLSRRVEAAKTAQAAGFNASGRLFSNAEVTQMTEMLKSDDPTQGMAVINGLSQMGGSARSAAAELGMDAGQVHLLSLKRLNVNDAVVAEALAGDKLKGEQRVRPHKEYEAEVTASFLSPFLASQEVDETEEAAITKQVVETARDIFAFKMQGAGLEAKDAEEVWEASLTQATGGYGGYGGVQDVNGYGVALPPNVSGIQANQAFEVMENAYSQKVLGVLNDVDGFQGNDSSSGDGGAFSFLGVNRALRDQERARADGGLKELSEGERSDRIGEFWSDISLSGGVPVLETAGGSRSLTQDELRRVRFHAVDASGRYRLYYFNGGEALPLLNSEDGAGGQPIPFEFDIHKLIQRTNY